MGWIIKIPYHENTRSHIGQYATQPGRGKWVGLQSFYAKGV